MTFKGDTFMEVASCLARTDPTDQPSFYTALEVVKRYCRTKIAKGKGRQFVGKGGKLEDLEKKYAHLGYQDIFYLTRLHMGFPPSSVDLPRPTTPIRNILIKAKYPLPREIDDPDPFGSPERQNSVSTRASTSESASVSTHMSTRSFGNDDSARRVVRTPTNLSRQYRAEESELFLAPPAPAEAPARRSSDLERLGIPETRENTKLQPIPPYSSPPPSTPLPTTPSSVSSRPSTGNNTLPLNVPRRHISNYFSSSASSIASTATSPTSPMSTEDHDRPRVLTSPVSARAEPIAARSEYSPRSGRPQIGRATSIEDDLLKQIASLDTRFDDNDTMMSHGHIMDRPRAAYQSVGGQESQLRKLQVSSPRRDGMQTPPPRYEAR